MVLAHGVGGRQDLPIPFWLAVTGAAIALIASFVALGALWREPRLGRADTQDVRPLPAGLDRLVSSTAWRWCWRMVGLVVAGYFTLGLWLGPDTAENPTAGAFYVLFWVGLVPASLLCGPFWRYVNPLRTVHLLVTRALRRDPRLGLYPLPPGLGYWPAAAGLLGFVWLELVAPERAGLFAIRVWLGAYAALVLTGAVVFGSRWFDRGDPFEAYSSVIGRLAPIGRDRDGVLVWRNPLDGLARLRPTAGLVALVVVLLGSTMYDSLSSAPGWVRFTQSRPVPAPVIGTAGLVVVIGLVAAAFLGAIAAARRAAGVGPGRRRVSTGAAVRVARGRWRASGSAGAGVGRRPSASIGAWFGHSLVPIAVGYLTAHYYSLFLLEGQRTLRLLSDPLDIGANWFGTANWHLVALGTSPQSIAALQVTVIVLGHVVGTVLAHDRALSVFQAGSVMRGQLPLLALMVGYTVLGLTLLFAT